MRNNLDAQSLTPLQQPACRCCVLSLALISALLSFDHAACAVPLGRYLLLGRKAQHITTASYKVKPLTLFSSSHLLLSRLGNDCYNMPEHREPTPDEDRPLNSSNPLQDQKGKKSKIYDYCNDARRSDKKCIWFCRQQGRRTVAWDKEIGDIENQTFKLQDFNDWWRRFAFYNYVGVRHVQVSETTLNHDAKSCLTSSL